MDDPNDNLTLVRRSPASVVLTPVMDVKLANQRLVELQEFCANYLQESKDGGTDGGDFGLIPGAGKKKTLFKSGADKLCDVYGLADRYTIISKVEDFERGLFDYTIECWLVRKTDEMFVGSGLGSCSSYEAEVPLARRAARVSGVPASHDYQRQRGVRRRLVVLDQEGRVWCEVRAERSRCHRPTDRARREP